MLVLVLYGISAFPDAMPTCRRLLPWVGAGADVLEPLVDLLPISMIWPPAAANGVTITRGAGDPYALCRSAPRHRGRATTHDGRSHAGVAEPQHENCMSCSTIAV